MIVLDTDHLSWLQRPGPVQNRLLSRLTASSDEKAITIISVQELVQGWMAVLNKSGQAKRLVATYAELGKLVGFFAAWHVLSFDEQAAAKFEELRPQVPRLGTHDLRIAAIVLCNNGLLLSANLRDFRLVPNLHVEDWAY